MKLGIARYEGRHLLAAERDGVIVDLSGCVEEQALLGVIEDWTRLAAVLEEALPHAKPLPHAVWAAPIPRPPKFLLLAGNFRAHIVESGFEAAPEENLTPQFFLKPSTTIIGPTDDIPLTRANHALDYESELAVVIGRHTKNATLENAISAVFGYTIVNDISERKLNDGMVGRKKRSNDDFYDWLVGKWFDGSAPMGPFVVTADELRAETLLDCVVSARLNGDEVQSAPLSAMIHSVAEAIVYISAVLTLEPGDVISIGTPSGVGMARGRLLTDGDVIECSVDGIGTLRNRIYDQAQHA
ncbi:2-keto-4-pentenoate hydratase/2-oxohepta-3-ene-1,7-dioic acid hydratase in catechol pathway [Granulicella aggregans]|uniref:2-keto-4-pentenoate hydratase/2-oxohepta-3-ene-1,7-dioic acid hydratase in catechol pathway n=1 Tax=Granulicella aggregans TaxID=474949 RepID=A0A7W8E574_9BACT|nr:fumarylacetoacetate hydrolase family protein [Granulicella aggregans]MBB5057920.1 2-keto-4-pentenoate hydratase/2-oxohepta-3-ene-1,7-dioic acid hydratase in catechol pathway [Granulicella aggregans]